MARYFFDIHDAAISRDEVGTELPSLAAARMRAMHMARLMVTGEANGVSGDRTWQIFVRDEQERTCFWLTFIATELLCHAEAILPWPQPRDLLLLRGGSRSHWLSEAGSKLEEALRLLDLARAPGEVGAHVDLAIHRLKAAIADEPANVNALRPRPAYKAGQSRASG